MLINRLHPGLVRDDPPPDSAGNAESEAPRPRRVHLFLHGKGGVGGCARHATIATLDLLAERLGADVPLVVWRNDYFGPVAADALDRELFYQAHREHVAGVVSLPHPSHGSLFNDAVRRTTDRHLTFVEALADPAFDFMTRQRLVIVRRDLYAQLARAVANV